MLRMLMSHLKVVNERYWYQEILYTGVGFERDEEGLVVGHHIREGIVKEVYSPICVPTPKALQKISSALAENPQKLLVPLVQMDCSDQFSDYNLDYLMKESSFSGIGYEFDEGYCRREALILKNNVCWV